MRAISRNNRLIPWFIGLTIILIADLYVGYSFNATSSPPSALAQFMVLVALPGVYLALMYETFVSQA